LDLHLLHRDGQPGKPYQKMSGLANPVRITMQEHMQVSVNVLLMSLVVLILLMQQNGGTPLQNLSYYSL